MLVGSNKISITLSGVLFVAVSVLGALKAWAASGVQLMLVATAVVGYLAWLVVGAGVGVLGSAGAASAAAAWATAYISQLPQGATVLTALALPSTPTTALVGLVGLVLMLVGICIRLSAVVTLGRYYSRRVRLLAGHQVITSGPYRLVRHPAYLGTLVGHLGFVAVFGSWIAMTIWAVLFVPMVIHRILLEEPVLFELNGYADYANQRKRLVPLVW